MRGMNGNPEYRNTPKWRRACCVLTAVAFLWFAPRTWSQLPSLQPPPLAAPPPTAPSAAPVSAAAPVPGTEAVPELEVRRIADVKVVGNKNIATDQLMRYIHVRKGNEYNLATIHADVLRLSNSRMFKSVRVREDRTPAGVVVMYFVDEYPNLIRDIIYKNAHHISRKDLDDMTRLRKGMPLDPVTNRNAAFEIQDYLRKKGRYFANVVLEEGDKASDSRVVFNVSEGPVVRIRSIAYEGNDELASSGRLKTQVDSKTAYFSMFGGVFQPAMIDADVIKLEEYYQANGYRDVRVTRELIFSENFSQVDVVFHIREGKRYRIGEVTVEGAKSLDRTQVQSIVRLKPGEYYKEATVKGDARNITDLYGWRGMQAGVQPAVYMVPDEPGVVRVQYEVREASPAKVGQIFITGNTVTQDRVIRRLVGLYPGQTLRYPELRIAEANLARANIFELNPEKGQRPSVSIIDTAADSEYKDILVQIQETQTGSLMFGAGVNSNAGLVGSIVLNERNFDWKRLPTSWADISEGRAFRGAGQEFRLEAVPGTQLQRYTASLREPFLFDRPYSLTTSGFYYTRIFNEYTEDRLGGRLTLAHQFSRAWSGNVGFRAEQVNVGGLSIFAPVDYTSVQGNNYIYAPSIGVTWDTRDSYLRPTEGGVLDLNYEQVFGTFTFPILKAEASRFITTYERPDGSGRHVFAMNLQANWAGADTPVFERFFAGGFRSLRGFRFRGVGPQVNGFMVGGNFMLLTSFEYQIPILANDNLYFVTFLDAGTVEPSVEIRDYRVAAGVGLRISVPMLGPVPIALDFGFPVNKLASDQTQVFNFWVGMFR